MMMQIWSRQVGLREERKRPKRPEIDRLQLRNLLLASITPSTIRWGHNLRSLSPSSSSPPQWQLTFDNGHVENFDVIIGADGGPLLASSVPIYTGITFVDLTILHESSHPQLSSLVGKGLIFITADSRGLIGQRNGGDKIRTYAALRVPENWAEQEGAFLHTADLPAIECYINTYFQGWAREALNLLRLADLSSMTVRKIYALPVTHYFKREGEKPGCVTAIGDAAHLMSPFAGEGVNLAMPDAGELALALVAALQSPSSLSPVHQRITAAIVSFEKAMFERSALAADESSKNIELIFHDNAPHVFVERMKYLMSGGGHGDPHSADPHQARVE